MIGAYLFHIYLTCNVYIVTFCLLSPNSFPLYVSLVRRFGATFCRSKPEALLFLLDLIKGEKLSEMRASCMGFV